ncbi:hypothetical protein KSP39_PZI020991 [Platanthera zijinensis]|uniref:Uncharacterized protein n=1 Tax=Platanthera zijinensis TaxID=2320716 RepID=A0AAP0FW80_9ASPA
MEDIDPSDEFYDEPLIEPLDELPHLGEDVIQVSLLFMSSELLTPIALSSPAFPQRMDIVWSIECLGHHLLTHRTLNEFWDASPADPPDELFLFEDMYHTRELRLLVSVHDFHSGGRLISDEFLYTPPGSW